MRSALADAPSKMHILITGGHLTPALALIDYIQTHTNDTVAFVGRLYSQETSQQKSQEKTAIVQRKVKFIPFTTAKLKSPGAVDHALQSLQVLKAVSQAWQIISREKPDVIVSFGGYLAFPVAVAGWLQRVPIVTHEQTRHRGQANSWIAKLATKVAISFPESKQYFPAGKTIVTGNLLREKLFEKSSKQPEWVKTNSKLPVLYITGGNQGSQIINTVIGQALAELTKEWFVVHQCGNPTNVVNYRRELEGIARRLPAEQRERYVVREWFDESDLRWIYHQAKLIISRAGANTIYELIALAKPSILIPLPLTHQDEQTLHGQLLESFGSAIAISQKDFTPAELLHQIHRFKRLAKTFQRSANEARDRVILDGTARFYQLLKSCITR